MERKDLTYDRELFIEVVESYPSVKYLRSDNLHEFHVRFYEGISSKLVEIDTTDLEDDITFSEGCGLLRELGLPDLIDVLFPPVVEQTEEQELAVMEGEILKEEALKGL